MTKRPYFPGIIQAAAIGAYVEEFLSDLMKSGIKLYEIKNNGGTVYITLRRTDYKKAALISRRHQIRIRVAKKNKKLIKSGTLNKYTGVLSGITISLLMIILSGKFIWKINVYGTDKLSEQQILNSIAECGIYIGAYSELLDTDTAEFSTKLNLDEISWINIEINGSRADVFINESGKIDEPEISVKTPCNVIAGRDGVIVETQVYSGTLLYPVGSGVSKGNIIISGVVNDGADNLIITHANGKIIAEFTESVQFRQEFKTKEKIKSNVEEYEKELLIAGMVIPLTQQVENTDNKICDEYVEKCRILGFTMPWSIKTNIYNIFDEVEIIRTVDDVNRLLQQKLELYCQNFYSEYEILDVQKNLVYDEKGITMTAVIKLKGDIAVQKEIMRKNNEKI